MVTSPPQKASAAPAGNIIIVDSTQYEVQGTWNHNPNGCHLPDAIRAANTNTSVGGCASGDPNNEQDVIVLTVDAPLFSATPTITSPVAIRGNGNVIDGRDEFRLLDISGADVDISNVVLQHGSVTGATGKSGRTAACYIGDRPYSCNTGVPDAYSGKKGGAAHGGAIRAVAGAGVTLNRVVITNNRVIGGEGGPSIIGGTGGTGGEAAGSAIYSDRSAMVITRSVISENLTVGGDGGVGGIGWPGAPGEQGVCSFGGPDPEPTDGDDGGQGGGGGVGGEAAAAVYARGGSISITNTELSSNSASGGNGNVGGDGGEGGVGMSLDCASWLPPQTGTGNEGVWTSDNGETGPQGTHGIGGKATSAIRTFGAALTMTSSTIAENSASTGDGGNAWSTTVNTVGGVQISTSTLVENTTNIRDGDDKRSPDIWSQKGQGQTAAVTLSNSVVARNSVILNTDTAVAPWQCESSVVSDGHNALSAQATDGACVDRADGDVVYAEDDLEADATDADPSYNLPGDGTTRVYVPTNSSQLVGQAACGASDTDQRGVVRPASGCDIGAYERDGTTPPNTAPIAASPVYLRGEAGDTVSVKLDHYFDDAETPDTLTYSAEIETDSGAVAETKIDLGNLFVTLNAGIELTQSTVSVTGTDPGGKTAELAVIIETRYLGEPVLTADNYKLTEGSSLTIAPTYGIFANDAGVGPGYDVDTSGLAFLPLGAVSGTITNIDPELGTFTYTPPEGFVGDDTFLYGLGNISSASTVTFHVVGQAVVYDDNYIAATGTLLTINSVDEGIYANDTGVPDDPTVVVEDNELGVDVNDDGTFSIQLPINPATYTFTYKIYAGGFSNTATVTIDVRDVDAAGESYVLDQDTTLTVGANDGLRSNDSETTGFELKVTEQPEHGELIAKQDGSFSYAPSEGYVGTDSFRYTYIDGADTAPVKATLTVRSTQVPAAEHLTYTTDEDVPLVIDDPADGLLSSASGFDGSGLEIALTSEPGAGSIDVNDDGTFTYDPAKNSTGTVTVGYTVSDGTSSVDVTASITVTAVNDAPIANADRFGVYQGKTLTLDADQGVLRNDTDIDGDALTATLVDEAAHGTITIAADGAIVYTPEGGFSGTDTFSYTASDGTASSTGTAEIVVLADTGTENPPAESVDDAFDAQQDVVLTVGAPGVLDNDAGTDLTAVVDTLPSHGTVTLNADGSFEYTPDAGWAGTETFTYKVASSSGVTGPATVTIEVHPAAAELTAHDDAYSTAADTALTVDAESGLRANDAWNESGTDAPTAVKISDPSSGAVTLSTDGSLSYTPEAGFVGTVSFEYVLEDASGARSEPATVTIVVTAAGGEAPTAGDDEYSGAEDASLSVDAGSGVAMNDSAGATVVLVDGPENGSLVLEATGAFVFMPEANWFGTDTFTYQALTAEGVSEPATVTLTVTAVNDAPMPSDDAYAAEAGTSLDVSADAGVLGNDSDVDGDELTVSAAVTQNLGQLTINADGSFVYAPPADGSVDDVFTYRVSDGTVTATATIRFVGEAPPEAVPTVITSTDHAEFTVGEDGTFTLTATGDGPIAFGLDGAPSWLSITQPGATSMRVAAASSAATLVGTPPEGSAGTYTFVVTAEAEGGATDQSFTLVVSESNTGGPGDGSDDDPGDPGASDDGPGGSETPTPQAPAASDQSGEGNGGSVNDAAGALPYTGPSVSPIRWTMIGAVLLLIGGALLAGSRRRRLSRR